MAPLPRCFLWLSSLLILGHGWAENAPEQFPGDSRHWSRAAEASTVADLAQVQPPAAVTKGLREKGKWKAVPFATAQMEGWALSAFSGTGAPTVRLPLAASGWHAVYLGLATTSNGFKEARNGLRAKLAREPVFRRLACNLPLLPNRRDQIQEQLVTVAQLAGDTLEMAQLPGTPATVCYVKLVPLTEGEAAAWTEAHSPAPSSTRTSIATFDGHSWIWPYQPKTAEDLLANFRGYEGTDIGKWWFEVLGADLTCYPTKVGNIAGAGTVDFPTGAHAAFTRAVEALVKTGVNPLKVARDEARRQGVEFHIMLRPAGWTMAIPHEETFNSKFFAAHPEWRCVDRDGTPTLYMSYAVPEVRQHLMEVLKETLELQPEGIGFVFNRGMPMILWEPAFCDLFQKKYGADARTVPEDDERILALRAEIMTELLTEWRAMLDETARAQGRPVPYRISLGTFSKEEDNRKFGLDLPRWIAAGLVDELAVAWFAHHTSFAQPDMAYYQRITAGSKVGVYPFVISWKTGKPQELCRKVVAFYSAGAKGIAIWDPVVESPWNEGDPGNVFDVLGHLGHRTDVVRWAKSGVPQPLSIPLTRLGENYYSRWFPGTGF